MAHADVPQMATDRARRRAFLDALRSHGGSFAAACRASAPHLDGQSRNPPAASTWRALMARDPEFAAQVEAVLQDVRDDIEAELHRRSMEGVEVPVFQKGSQAKYADGRPAYVTKYSDSLLLARARALMPDRYGEKKDINVSVRGGVGAWSIGLEDLVALSQPQKDNLAEIINTIRQHHRATLRLEHKGAVEVLDAEYQAVTEEGLAEFDLGYQEVKT